MRRLFAFTILLLLVIGCAPGADVPPATQPQPSEPTCDLFDDLDVINKNPCLLVPYGDIKPMIVVPDGWQYTEVLANSRGEVDAHTGRIQILDNGYGLVFYPHNAVHGLDGQWGYEQTVHLEPGEYMYKIIGIGRINDPPNNDKYKIVWLLDGVELAQQTATAQGYFELVYSFTVEQAGDYTIGFRFQALYGTAGHESQMLIRGMSVSRLD